MQNADEWTIERWRTAPRVVDLELRDTTVEKTPPLWKDVTLASVLAVLLWGAAVAVFG
jgi:hypothetical protein